MRINKFIAYRIESILLLLIFIGAFVAAIYTQQNAWIMGGWATSIILQVHLYRVRCPKCNMQLMKRSKPKTFQPKWRMFFPRKCDSCKKDL